MVELTFTCDKCGKGKVFILKEGDLVPGFDEAELIVCITPDNMECHLCPQCYEEIKGNQGGYK